MKRWFGSKESKKVTSIIIVVAITVAAQILGFLYYNKRLYDMSLDHSTQQVEELSMYVQKTFQLELEHHVQMLQVIQQQLNKEDRMFSEEMVSQLKNFYENSNFRLLGISDLDGNGIDSTGDKHNILYKHIQNHIREEIEDDKVYISNIIKKNNEPLVFIAIPLKLKDQISGILWGKFPLEDIINNINFTEDAYKYFQIIDDKGNYLLPSKSKFAINKNCGDSTQTIWNELGKYQYRDGMSAEKIHEMVKKGKSGNFYFEYNGEGRYVNYRPLKINNWYLFSVQVEDGLHVYVNRTWKITIRFFIVLTIGLLAVFGTIYNLIYTMYKRIAHQHQEMQAINTMFQATLEQTKNIPFIIDRKQNQVILYGYPTRNDIRHCTFDDVCPEKMLEKEILPKSSLETYKNLYKKIIEQGQKCEPTILYSQFGEKKEWIRVSIVSDAQTPEGQMTGVLEGYGEQKEKDMQIENHLYDIKIIEQKSQLDFLTGLYNRETFIEKVNIALKENRGNQHKSAFLILDLDYFKDVNDCMGHSMGDIVLQEIANKLRNFFRKEDIVGRIGGDEFVVFAQSIQNISAFERRIKELNELLCKSYYKDGKNVKISASIGIMMASSDCLNFQELYEKADRALYNVKQSGRNGYQIYSK